MEEDMIEYLKMITNVNLMFEQIKYDSFKKFHSFENVINKNQQYNVLLDSCDFKLGKGNYEILPVGTTARNRDETTFIAFDDHHPSQLFFKRTDEIIRLYDLPSVYFNKDINDGKHQCYKFGYKLSAIICEKVNGKSFLSISLDNGTTLWLVIVKSKNSTAKHSLNLMDNNITTLTDMDANDWYQHKSFNVPLDILFV